MYRYYHLRDCSKNSLNCRIVGVNMCQAIYIVPSSFGQKSRSHFGVREHFKGICFLTVKNLALLL